MLSIHYSLQAANFWTYSSELDTVFHCCKMEYFGERGNRGKGNSSTYVKRRNRRLYNVRWHHVSAPRLYSWGCSRSEMMEIIYCLFIKILHCSVYSTFWEQDCTVLFNKHSKWPSSACMHILIRWTVESGALRGTMVSLLLSPCAPPNWAPRHEGVLGEWRFGSTHSLSSALNGGK
jgi:hypothetical protein